MKYVYAAVFTPLDDGNFFAAVPDLAGCASTGENIADTLEMIEDAAAMWLWDCENDKEPIPNFTAFEQILTQHNQFKSLILIDTDDYRRKHENKAVKKTLTLPSWLNAEAEQAGINFSQILQEGLKTRLGVQ